MMNLPDLDDMDYDPAGVYQALTGVENAAATSQDCMSIVLDRVTEKVRALSRRDENSKSSGQTYTYTETDFIKALKNGYVIEIQEPSTIVQPGVLVGLNSLLEQTGTITLPTGEVIKRHPDASRSSNNQHRIRRVPRHEPVRYRQNESGAGRGAADA